MYQLTHSSHIIRIDDKAEIPADPENRDYAEYLAWLEDGNEPLPPPDPEPLPPQYPRLTALEMLDQFTEAEQLGVVAATMTEPAIKLWYDRLIAATYVTYDDPRTEAGLQALVDAELITPERKADIVAAMQPQET